MIIGVNFYFLIFIFLNTKTNGKLLPDEVTISDFLAERCVKNQHESLYSQ